MNLDPIFILGTERSGSNLLRLILNAHSRITIPHPPHIVRYFAPLERGYGDLSVDANFKDLVSDVLRLVEIHIYPWEVKLDVEKIIRTAPERSVFGVYVAIYEQHRDHVSKPRWGCKSTFMIDHAATILRHFPDAKMLLLVRDPRDVVSSSKRAVFSTYQPYFTAQLWRDQQMTGLELLKTLPEKNICLVHYEELVKAPDATVQRICAFLGEAFEPPMLRYFDTQEARKSAQLSEAWQNTGKPILSGNTSVYKDRLTHKEILLVEAIAREPMERLNYAPLHTAAELDAVQIDRSRYMQFWLEEQILRCRTEVRSALHDRNVLLRWKRGALMSYLGLRRGLWAAYQGRRPRDYEAQHGG